MFGDKLKEYRKANGLTQKELGEKIGVAEITVRQYESGKRTPSSEDLVKIACKLKLSPKDLDDRLVISYNDVEVLDEAGNRYFLDPTVEVLTKDGVMTLMEFGEEKQAGRMTDDDLVKYRNANPRSRVDEAWEALNESGRQKAADQVELVAKVPEYRK